MKKTKYCIQTPAYQSVQKAQRKLWYWNRDLAGGRGLKPSNGSEPIHQIAQPSVVEWVPTSGSGCFDDVCPDRCYKSKPACKKWFMDFMVRTKTATEIRKHSLFQTHPRHCWSWTLNNCNPQFSLQERKSGTASALSCSIYLSWTQKHPRLKPDTLAIGSQINIVGAV